MATDAVFFEKRAKHFAVYRGLMKEGGRIRRENHGWSDPEIRGENGNSFHGFGICADELRRISPIAYSPASLEHSGQFSAPFPPITVAALWPRLHIRQRSSAPRLCYSKLQSAGPGHREVWH